ncbi:MAG TPA: nuclear transport factor 2 family protein [Parafilimonas sp.]|nr:nuclear transport factor 2 family protein [Parafilimonas sp.]
MKTFVFLLIMNIFYQYVPTQTSIASNADLIKEYLKSKENIMQQNATTEDVEKLMSFYSDSLYYEHVLSPEKKFAFHGKDDLRSGYTSHLGETNDAKIKLLTLIEKQNIVIVQYSLIREIISSHKTEESKIVSIFEFDDKAKIKHMTDYL